MAQTASAPRLIQAVGSFTELVVGVAGGSGTSTVVTIPQLSVVQGVIVGSATSATGAFAATVSGNTFTATTANNDLFAYIAWGKARV